MESQMNTAVKVLTVLVFAAASVAAPHGGAFAGERLYSENFSLGLPCGWDVLLDDGGGEVTLVQPGDEASIITAKSYENASGKGLEELWTVQRDFLLSACDCKVVRESIVTINGVRWKRLMYMTRYGDEEAYFITMFTVGGGFCFKLNYSGVSYKTFMDNMPDFDVAAGDIRLFDTYKRKAK